MVWTQISPALSPEVIALLERRAEEHRPHPIFDRSRHGTHSILVYLDQDAQKAAQEFTAACAVDPAQSPVLKHAAEALPASFFNVLIMTCGLRIGMESVEKTMGWPTRSCKLVLAMALQELIRREVV